MCPRMNRVTWSVYEEASSSISSGVGRGKGTAAGESAIATGEPGTGEAESGRRRPVKAFS